MAARIPPAQSQRDLLGAGCGEVVDDELVLPAACGAGAAGAGGFAGGVSAGSFVTIVVCEFPEASVVVVVSVV